MKESNLVHYAVFILDVKISKSDVKESFDKNKHSDNSYIRNHVTYFIAFFLWLVFKNMVKIVWFKIGMLAGMHKWL